MTLPLNIRRTGAETPPPQPIPLRAGPLQLLFEAGCLRYIRLGDTEVLRRIYVAVRDRHWGTAPDELSHVEITKGEDAFRISYDVSNRLGEVDFAWRGEIMGDADGTICFSMDGEAHSDFSRARIGFCVLPPMSCAGHRARVVHVDGSQEETTFPQTIAPQLVVDGQIKPVSPFDEMKSLSYEATTNTRATVEFEGDIFEMEDQRNWTDASYKIYSTPLRLPFPVQVKKGDRVRQAITLRLSAKADFVPADSDVVTLRIGDEPLSTLPSIGLGIASHGRPLSEQSAQRLRTLRPAHLRVDVDLADDAHIERFRQACAEAAALDCALEIALFADAASIGKADSLTAHLQSSKTDVARWIVFDGGGLPAPSELVQAVRTKASAYDENAPVGGGTNVYFTELNRYGPNPDALDFMAYSLNPQVHASDNLSLMETPPAQAVTVESAKRLSGGKPVIVSPVTLKPRYNPHATGPESEPAPGRLPPQVDVRQMALFGAAWTVASIKHLAEAGAASVTYFETTGWRGVMETQAGNAAPDLFQSAPGGVFPMFHVFTDVAALPGADVLPLTSSNPLAVEGLALRHGSATQVLIANLSSETQSVVINGLPDEVSVRMLDEESFDAAVSTPERYRNEALKSIVTHDGGLETALLPYAVLYIRTG